VCSRDSDDFLSAVLEELEVEDVVVVAEDLHTLNSLGFTHRETLAEHYKCQILSKFYLFFTNNSVVDIFLKR
jgi:hypothetical protein